MIPEDPTKYWDVKGETEEGLTQLELDPPLQVLEPEDITLDRANTLCHLLQIDPDKVIFGGEGTIELPDHPPLIHAKEVFDILVVNSDEYNIEEMPASQVKILLGSLTTYFMKACQQS